MPYNVSPTHWPKYIKKSGIAVTLGTIADVFTVVGPVRITSFFGRVATVIGAGAATLQWVADVGGTDSNLCAASASIANAAVGRIFTVVGTVATAMSIGTGDAAAQGTTTPLYVNTCTLDLVVGTGTTGTVDWFIGWEPMDAGANIS